MTPTTHRWTQAVRHTVLPNGLTVLIEPNPSAPVIASVAYVRAGYFDEPDHLVGISHVLEHMYFKGTPRRPEGAMAEETQRLGGYLNAGTIYDKTMYYTVVPSGPGVMEQIVDIQADGLQNLLIEPASLERELEVIIQEANRKLDSPSSVTIETLYSQLFAQHRIRRWRIGTEDGLRRLTADDVREYYRSRYTPERTIVALVGDLDPDHALDVVRRAYDDWSGGTGAIEGSPPETSPPDPSIRILTGDVKRPQVAVGWRTVGARHPDTVVLDMAASILGSGTNAWLSRYVRREGLASSVGAHHYTPLDVGVFDLTCSGSGESIQEAVDTSLGLVQRLVDAGPETADLERIRSLMTVGWAKRLETMDTRAVTFCSFEAMGGVELLDEHFDELQGVTPESVHEVARRYLNADMGSATVYAPEDHATCVSTDWPRAPDPPPVGPVRSVVLPPLKRTDTATPPASVGPVLHRADPGVDVLVRPRRGSGLAHVALYVPRIREFEDETLAGVSALVTRSALRGTGRMNADELAFAAERLGGNFSSLMLAGGAGWSLTVPMASLSDAVALLYHVARDASFTEKEVLTERDVQVNDAVRAQDDMYGFPVMRSIAAAHPGTAHGLPTLGVPEHLRTLEVDAVHEWVGRMRSRRAALVVVGDDEPEALVDATAGIGHWSGTEHDVPSQTSAWHPAAEVIEREKAQTAIAMAFPASPHGQDRYPLLVLASLLSGLSGRLFHELRERRSLAYTVNATAWQRHTAGAMLTYIATDPKRESEARDGMLEVLASVVSNPPEEDELLRARRYVAGGMQLRVQSSGALAAETYQAWNRGELDHLERDVEGVMGVTVEELVDVAGRLFVPDQRSECVVRGV